MERSYTFLKVLFLTFVFSAFSHVCYSAGQVQAASDTTLSSPVELTGTYLDFVGRCVLRDTVTDYAIHPTGPSHLAIRSRSDLGLVSFVSDQEWIIKGGGITQIWSDAVQATGCNKTEFRGDFHNKVWFVDCRSNPDHPGDLFSWCAVDLFASDLCPAPWRVPTAEDFCNLDKFLIGQGLCYSHETTPDHLRETYIDVWGGTLSGGAGSRGSLFFGDVKAYYWSSTEHDDYYAFYLYYDVHGSIKSQCIESAKPFGFSLRCVRDAE